MPIEHDCLGEAAQRGLRAYDLAQPGWILHQRRRGLVDVLRHGKHVGGDVVLMLLEIRLGHGQGFVDDGLDAVGEPGVDAEIEEKQREDGDDDGRRHRHDAEEEYELTMEPGAREAAPAFGPEHRKAPHHHGAEQHQENQVDIEKQNQQLRVRPDHESVGQRPVGSDAGGGRGEEQP